MTDDERRVVVERIAHHLGQNGELDDHLRRVRSLSELGDAKEFHAFIKTVRPEEVRARNAAIEEILNSRKYSASARKTRIETLAYFSGILTFLLIFKDAIIEFFLGNGK